MIFAMVFSLDCIEQKVFDCTRSGINPRIDVICLLFGDCRTVIHYIRNDWEANKSAKMTTFTVQYSTVCVLYTC